MVVDRELSAGWRGASQSEKGRASVEASAIFTTLLAVLKWITFNVKALPLEAIFTLSKASSAGWGPRFESSACSGMPAG